MLALETGHNTVPEEVDAVDAWLVEFLGAEVGG